MNKYWSILFRLGPSSCIYFLKWKATVYLGHEINQPDEETSCVGYQQQQDSCYVNLESGKAIEKKSIDAAQKWRDQ